MAATKGLVKDPCPWAGQTRQCLTGFGELRAGCRAQPLSEEVMNLGSWLGTVRSFHTAQTLHPPDWPRRPAAAGRPHPVSRWLCYIQST